MESIGAPRTQLKPVSGEVGALLVLVSCISEDRQGFNLFVETSLNHRLPCTDLPRMHRIKCKNMLSHLPLAPLADPGALPRK